MNKKWALLALSFLGMSGAVQAELLGRDLDGYAATFEAYYDTDLDITWLADANYAKTSGYDADGKMTWSAANIWVAQLNINGYDNWRLPTVEPVNGTTFNYNGSFNGSTDYGYNISEQGSAFTGSTGSEMAHLYYNTLNNKGYCDPALATANSCSEQAGWGLTNTDPFNNLQADDYWSATEYEYAPGTYAWLFSLDDGSQNANVPYLDLYALAVSPGDVATVPEPETYAMMLGGLVLVGAAARRRRG